MGTFATSEVVATELTTRASEAIIHELTSVIATRLRYFHLIALRHLGNIADAEDAAQDAFISAWKNLSQFRGSAQLSTWLTTIVINAARGQMRRRRREVHLSLDQEDAEQRNITLHDWLPDHRPGPEDILRARELAELVVRSSTGLPPIWRKSYQLRETEGLNIREAAKTLGITHGALKARNARARATIRKIVAENGHARRGTSSKHSSRHD
jgi:RNA polymerase sigma-70 factor (ECF subfamily)